MHYTALLSHTIAYIQVYIQVIYLYIIGNIYTMKKKILVSLEENDALVLDNLARQAGLDRSAYVKSIIGAKTYPAADFLAGKKNSTANAVIEEALQALERRDNAKVIKGEYFYSKDTLTEAFGIEKLSKDYQTDSFINRMELILYE